MSDDHAAKVMEFLVARSLAMGDVVARLLAYEAKRTSDPLDLLREFSEMGDKRLVGSPSQTAIRLQFAEAIRTQTDWLIAAARKMAIPDETGDDEDRSNGR
jgi:hypothetical protein